MDSTESVRVLGESDVMRRVRDDIRLLAAVDATVLIEGETGTGKTLVARAIHAASRRHAGPFVSSLGVWPCEAPLADGAVAAQVPNAFGGVAFGAAVGSVAAGSVDLFEAARGGTLLLEEIGEMTLRQQASLLRILEAPDRANVDGRVPRGIDVRVLATTHRPLDRAVAAGRFRQDLFYRIRVVRIVLPPLRQRSRDIPVLAHEFLRGATAAYGKQVETISGKAMDHLTAYRWPGNVRELHATIDAAVIRADGRTLQPIDVRQTLAQDSEKAPRGRPSTLPRERVLDALERAGGNRTVAARLLGIGRATLYRHLGRFDRLDGDRDR